MIRLRKLVHVGGALFVPVALHSQQLALCLAVLGLLVFLVVEGLKRKLAPGLVQLFYHDRELSRIAAEPLMYLSSIIALLAISLLFMPSVCYATIIVLTVGDSVAAIVGKALEGPKLPGSAKTWPGTLSGFTLASICGYLIAGPMAIAGAAAGMIAEAYGGRADNVLVATAAFICMAALSFL